MNQAALKTTGTRVKEIAFVGNPNCGKTTLFNALTGLRQSTGNYPGVTVEKKTSRTQLGGESVDLLDLPGSYSLLARSPDEQVVHDVLFGIQKGTKRPDLVVMILDAGNLERNMFLLSQIMDLNIPIVVAVTMADLAHQQGITVDMKALEALLGCPCVQVVGNRGVGVPELKQALEKQIRTPVVCHPKAFALSLPEIVVRETERLHKVLGEILPAGVQAVQSEALRLIADVDFTSTYFQHGDYADRLKAEILDSRKRLEDADIDWSSVEAEKRYERIEQVCVKIQSILKKKKRSVSDLMDLFLTHRVWGLLAFGGVMITIFQSIFTWAGAPMDWISSGVEGLSAIVAGLLPDGQLESLVVDGMIAGVGNVVIFLPQILLLFFFIALLEDFGYMARAAFVLDRLMRKVGLNGKAFLPLLSSFACAIPGVMAARTMSQKNDRLATIMVAPLMSCSARLPVYTLMIGAFIPATPVLHLLDMKGLTLFSMYFLSLSAGLGMAALFRKTLLKGDPTPFVFELPPYRLPHLKTVFMTTWIQAREFLMRAGTIIFLVSIVLWFLASYPKDTERQAHFEGQRQAAEQTLAGDALDGRLEELTKAESGEALRMSFAGRLGKLIEPVIEPLGFDWKLGIGIIASFAAREVLVSTLAIVYNVGADADETSVDLIGELQGEVKVNGQALYTPLTAVSLMVFFVLACQCMSTVAVVYRETNGWRWPIFMIVYMTALAWSGSFVTYQGGKLLGFE